MLDGCRRSPWKRCTRSQPQPRAQPVGLPGDSGDTAVQHGRATTALRRPLPITPQHRGAGRTDRQRVGTQDPKAALSDSFSPRKKLKQLLQPGPEGARRRRVAPRQVAVPTGRSPGRAGTFAFQVSAVPRVKAAGLLQGDSTLARLGAQGSRLGPKVTGKSVPGCTACCSPPCHAGRHAWPLTAMQGTRGGHTSVWHREPASCCSSAKPGVLQGKHLRLTARGNRGTEALNEGSAQARARPGSHAALDCKPWEALN